MLEGPNGQPLIVTGPPGGTFFVFPLPFGSYSPEQPPIQLEVQARMIGTTAGALGTQVNVTAGGGFYLGLDPLDDPSTDPPIIADPVTEPISPAVMLINKQYLGPEGETATGPNFVQTWQLNINIADGQTIDNLVLSDNLAPSLQFVSASSVLVDGVPVPASDIVASSDPSTTEPGGLLLRQLRSVIGTTADPDVTMDVNFYMPQYLGGTESQPILAPATGNPTDGSLSPISNTATAGGTWVPASGSPFDLRAGVGHGHRPAQGAGRAEAGGRYRTGLPRSAGTRRCASVHHQFPGFGLLRAPERGSERRFLRRPEHRSGLHADAPDHRPDPIRPIGLHRLEFHIDRSGRWNDDVDHQCLTGTH